MSSSKEEELKTQEVTQSAASGSSKPYAPKFASKKKLRTVTKTFHH